MWRTYAHGFVGADIDDAVAAPETLGVEMEMYFKALKAVGATGPYRVAPNLMVVIPTHNQVTLNYGHTPIDTGSEIFSVVVIFRLTFFAVLPESSVRRFSRRRSA